MTCPGEHIHRRDFLQLIAVLGKSQNIAREGCRIAGDVNHAPRLHRRDSRDGFRAHALAAMYRLNIYGADVWPQVRPVVEIVLDNAQSADYLAVVTEHNIPAGGQRSP